MHTRERLRADIERRFGFFPSFFAPALGAPEVLEGLWHQTQTAYLDNPLPAAFKERLFAYLSRLGACSYCVVTHSCQLRALGASTDEIFDLLRRPLGAGSATGKQLLGAGDSLAAWSQAGSPQQARILALAAHAFVDDELAERCSAELRGLLGPARYAQLVHLISYIRGCHDWVHAHPAISYRDDARVLRHLPALMREEPRLRELFEVHDRSSTLARQASRALAQFGTVAETLPALLRVLGEGLGSTLGSIWMPTRRHGVARLRAAVSWHDPAVDGAAFEAANGRLRLDPGGSLPGRVWETGRARWVADTADESCLRGSADARHDCPGSRYLLPVSGRDGVVAVIELVGSDARPPDPIVLETLSRISSRVGDYLERKGAQALAATAA